MSIFYTRRRALNKRYRRLVHEHCAERRIRVAIRRAVEVVRWAH